MSMFSCSMSAMRKSFLIIIVCGMSYDFAHLIVTLDLLYYLCFIDIFVWFFAVHEDHVW